MLAISQQFFDFLNHREVRYCHWKSNEHLEEALSGKTDLDVLIHADDKEVFQAALSKFDFKCVLSPPEKQFPRMEDYLGFDAVTGGMIHLHVHFRLVLGQKFIKNHHLPLESLFFDNLTEKYGVYIPCPEIELILLIIRAHLKTDLISLAKHAIKDMLGQRYTAFPKDIEDELRALQLRIDSQKFARLLRASELPISQGECNRFLEKLSKDKLRFFHIMLWHFVLLYRLRPYKRSSSVGLYFSYFRQYVFSLPLVAYVRPYKKKTLAGPGKVLSIVGADGSGKSTLIHDLNKWLSWKLTVNTYYYGIPKNLVSTLTSLLMRIFWKLGLRSMASHMGNAFWLYVARHRKSVSDRAKRDIDDGRVVITDRFPLTDFRDMEEPMDNPRIDATITFLGKNLRELEEIYYDDIRVSDRIIVLQVDIDELRRRKTDIALDKHQLKAAAVNSITATDSVMLIDANKPYKDVLLEVKQIIWQAL